MAKRKRDIQLKFRVTPQELELIETKMAQFGTTNMAAYLRKMAIDGYIIYTDTTEIKAFTSELSAIGRNINQIAKRINATGSPYQADMEEIRERLDQMAAQVGSLVDGMAAGPGKFNICCFGGAAIGGYKELPIRFFRVADIVDGRFQR